MIFAPPESARSILEKRYYQPGEDWEGMCRRVARFAAQVEEEPVRREWEDKFFRLMSQGLALPNSPALANGGTGKKGSVAACFTFTVEDTIESILEVRRLAAMTLKYGGGVGFEVSSLRPRGFSIQSTHRSACITGDALIPVEGRGIIPLREVREGDTIQANASTRVAAFHDNGIREVYKVTTERGYSVTSTLDHKFLTLKGNGTFGKTELGDLNIGDAVCLLRSTWPAIEAAPELQYTELQDEYSSRRNKILAPQILDEKLAYLLGLYFADGHSSRVEQLRGRRTAGGISFHLSRLKDQAIREKVDVLVTELFGLEPHWETRQNKLTGTISSSNLYSFLEQNNFLKQEMSQLQIPRQFYQAGPRVVSAFISGYFDGDGHIDGGKIQITSISKGVLNEFQSILLMLGCPSRMHKHGYKREGHRDSWRLSISSAASFKEVLDRVFQESVRFCEFEYPEHESASSIHVNLSRVISSGGRRWEAFGILGCSQFYSDPTTSRKLLRKMASLDLLFEEERKRLEFIRDKIVTDRITSVELVGQEPVYNLTVADDLHAYSANGFFISNCGPVAVVKDYNALGDLITQGGMRKAALLALLRVDHPDIIEFIHCKEKDKALANFNISVAIPDGFMKKLLKERDKPHVCYFGGKQYYLLQDGTPILRTEREAKKVISVGDIWELISSHAALNGDPGLLFVDTINRANPFIDGPEDVSNPLYFKGANPCLAGDTELLTKDGPRTIDFLLEGKESWAGELWTGKSWNRAIVWSTGVKDVVTLDFGVGHTFTCTPDHKIKVDEDWVPAGELEGRLIKDAEGRYLKADSVYSEPEPRQVYDFSILSGELHQGWANGLIVKNCGEVLLPHSGACILGSVDLAKYVKDGVINNEALYISFREMTRMLDNLLEVSPWPDPLIEETMRKTRQIGVGIMGFTSMLDKLGIRYGSEESLKIIDTIGALRQKACSDESIQLGKERGIYPAAKEGEIHRNSIREVNPPTGTLAMFANTSWAIEPHLFWAFEERRNDETRTRYLPIVEELIAKEQLESLETEAIGDLRKLNELIQRVLPPHMTLSRDLSPEEQLAVVARWQKYTGNSTSKTIVSSKDVLTPEKVEDIFQAAWELKLKGITVYAEGSREGEPMGISKKKTPKIVLPDELDSKRFKVELDVDGQPMKAFLHVGFHPSDKLKPVEIFLQHPYTKNLTFVQFVSALTRLVSLSLRYRTCPYCGEEALPIGQIIKQLDETDGQSLFSVPKMLTHVLSKFAGDGEVVGRCPECGADLVTTGRCVSCSAGCGWSRCG